MPTIRIQHSFQGSSGVARDQYVNTFHVVMASYDNAALTAKATAIKRFYHVQPDAGGPHPINWWLAGMSDAPGAAIRMYDLSHPSGGGVSRQPIYEEIYAPGASGGDAVPLPSEVACCLSYAAEPQTGVPVARTRGRIYIGPLSSTAVQTVGTGGIARPDLGFRAALCSSAKRLGQELESLDPVSLWCVHSESAGDDFPIVRWWVDDAWDTQRRRGDAPTSREVESL